MNLLEMVSEPKQRNPMITIYGEPGVGKTTLASTFRKAVIIRTEDGTQSIVGSGVKEFPICYKYQSVVDQITALIDNDHDFETLIIDSISTLDLMVAKQALIDDNTTTTGGNNPEVITPKTLNMAHGKFGGGNLYAGTLHGKIWRGCNVLNKKKGMTIVFIGHTRSKDFDSPDMASKYARLELDVNKQALVHYISNVDVVAYIKMNSNFQVDKKDKTAKTKIVSFDERLLLCQKNLTYLTKNRYGITKDIKLVKGVNPFEFAIVNNCEDKE